MRASLYAAPASIERVGRTASVANSHSALLASREPIDTSPTPV